MKKVVTLSNHSSIKRMRLLASLRRKQHALLLFNKNVRTVSSIAPSPSSILKQQFVIPSSSSSSSTTTTTTSSTCCPNTTHAHHKQHQHHDENKILLEGTIFRRQLPPHLTELSSEAGQKLFTESLIAGNAQCFFRLMEQLHTQAEPEYCGLATLVTILNAFDVDPGRRWKGNWRFFSEDLLDCCEPLPSIKKVGIDFDKFETLAKCNGLNVQAQRATASSLEDFRNQVIESSTTNNSFLAFAYSRKMLGQTGDGHYSPMGAYHKPSDQVLILDCARFKYRPHWCPLPMMFQSMSAIDKATQQSRGFLKFTKQLAMVPAIVNFSILPRYSNSPVLLKGRILEILGGKHDNTTLTSVGELLGVVADELNQRLVANVVSNHVNRKDILLKQMSSTEIFKLMVSYGDSSNSKLAGSGAIDRCTLLLSLDPKIFWAQLREGEVKDKILELTSLNELQNEEFEILKSAILLAREKTRELIL